MKKIYYIANARMPTEKAHGIQLAKMCESFVEQGIDLELVAPRRRTTCASLKGFYGLRTDVPIKKIPVIDRYVSGRMGFFVSSVSFALGYFFYLLGKRLRGEKFIIYMTDIDQFSFFLIPFLRVPYFCEIHDAKKKRLPFVLLFNNACGIITINAIIKKELSETYDIASDRIIVHPNGIDLNMFTSLLTEVQAKNILKINADKPIVLYAGGFYEWKGLGDLVRAARLIGRDVAWYLVGGNENDLMRVSGIKEIPSSIHCMGHRKFMEIPIWLAAADIVLVLGTKKNEYSYLHTSPMKFFEYMASKKPIVASNTPANRQIVSDREAMLYEPDNANDLAEKIRYAVGHRGEGEIRAANAYEKVKEFSWSRRAKSIIEFIEHRV